MQTAAHLSTLSSMATRRVLAELAAEYLTRGGIHVTVESVGGVDAIRRLLAGEPFDMAVLAADAIDQLVDGGRIEPASYMEFARSPVAVAVPLAVTPPVIDSAAALRATVLSASSVGHSTGPSGKALLELFADWGIGDQVESRLVKAPPGVPVGRLIAEGQVALGFQQLSEMLDVPGIRVVGPLPPDCAIESIFAAGCCLASAQPAAVEDFITFLRSPTAGDALRRHGMVPA